MKTCLLIWLCPLLVWGEVTFQLDIKPLPEEFQPLEPLIRTHILTAAKEWAGHFETKDCTIDIEFSLRPWPHRGTGRSFVAAYYSIFEYRGRRLSEEGVAHELRTGNDPNGAAPDIQMFFDPAYFRTFWWDPDPATRTAPLPPWGALKLDAYSIILHELGHAFGFNGILHPQTGTAPSRDMRLYDMWITYDGTNFWFHGTNAVRLHGKPVLMGHTRNTYHHVGDSTSKDNGPLATDLMNSIMMDFSFRYTISKLDLAILADCGYTLKKELAQAAPSPKASSP